MLEGVSIRLKRIPFLFQSVKIRHRDSELNRIKLYFDIELRKRFLKYLEEVIVIRKSQRISASMSVPQNTSEIFIAEVTFLTLKMWICVQGVMTVKN